MPRSRRAAATMPSGMPTTSAIDERVHHQLESGEPVLDDDLGDESVVGECRAEVAGEHLTEVLEVLDDHGSVVPRLRGFAPEAGRPAAGRPGPR